MLHFSNTECVKYIHICTYWETGNGDKNRIGIKSISIHQFVIIDIFNSDSTKNRGQTLSI